MPGGRSPPSRLPQGTSESCGGILLDHDKGCRTSGFGECLFELQNQCQVPGRQLTGTDDVRRSLHRLPRDLFRSLEQQAMSTTNPRSANDSDAMTFCPRSWPSQPIFAMRIPRGGPRTHVAQAAMLRCTVSTCALVTGPVILEIEPGYRPCADRTISSARHSLSPRSRVPRGLHHFGSSGLPDPPAPRSPEQ